MPLRLDLYHEIARQKAMQRRDPLKLGLFFAIAVAALCAVYYFYNVSVQLRLSQSRSALENQISMLAPKVAEAKAREDELSTAIKGSEAMNRWVEDRFYWAPVLALVSEVVPREAQIDRFSGDINGDTYKKVTITLAGLASGQKPRETAEQFKNAIQEKFSSKYNEVMATFNNSLDDSPLTVTLDNETMKTVSFIITLTFTVGEKPVPPPPKRVRPAPIEK